MVNQKTMVVIAASSFVAAIHIAMCENFKKLFKPEEMTLRSLTGEAGTQKERLMQILQNAHLSALIGMDVQPDDETIASYSAAKIPIVLTNEVAAGVSTVAVDNFVGGRIAGEYLVKKGRKKIAIVSGKTKVSGGYNAAQRLKGFQQALSVSKLSIPQGCTIEVPEYSREDGVQVMPKLLDIGVDAIFCAAGDKCAQGLLAVARERGIRVPEDVAIIGFDDLLIARLSTPALTTIRQPLKEMAEAAYKMTVAQRDEVLRKPQNIVFHPEIVIRKSA
jgi:DNA-binding LacI/PurR family transcriptional regulator